MLVSDVVGKKPLGGKADKAAMASRAGVASIEALRLLSHRHIEG